LKDDSDPKIGSMSAPPSVEFRGVTKAYGDNQVLRGFDLKVPTSQRVALIGRSGSGKTTLLRLLMTIERPDSGIINVEGEPLGWREIDGKIVWQNNASLRKVRGKIGMVFQHFNLFPHMTVLDNVIEAPVHVLDIGRKEAIDRAHNLLSLVGMSEKAKAWPRQLSGGQQQRAAIARALAMEPRIMLFDEITSALDPELVGEVLRVVRQIAKDKGMTMLIVTHEMNFARDVADRVIFMAGGKIVEDGPPEIVLRDPAQPETRSFLRSILER
jgi:polar amino acid transport system ATP-binding protein